jgi:hypothetical protein
MRIRAYVSPSKVLMNVAIFGLLSRSACDVFGSKLLPMTILDGKRTDVTSDSATGARPAFPRESERGRRAIFVAFAPDVDPAVGG